MKQLFLIKKRTVLILFITIISIIINNIVCVHIPKENTYNTRVHAEENNSRLKTQTAKSFIIRGCELKHPRDKHSHDTHHNIEQKEMQLKSSELECFADYLNKIYRFTKYIFNVSKKSISSLDKKDWKLNTMLYPIEIDYSIINLMNAEQSSNNIDFEETYSEVSCIEENNVENEYVEYEEIVYEECVDEYVDNYDYSEGYVEEYIETPIITPDYSCISIAEFHNLDEALKEEIRLLALTIDKESDGSLEDSYGVASVVVNRMNSTCFPNTIYDVLVEPYQYSWVNENSLYDTPKDSSIQIAMDVLINGNNIFPDNVVFQAQFVQGSGIHTVIGVHYYCYL